MLKVLFLHQGSELYGSDRSFHSSVLSLSDLDVEVEVILPSPGPLAEKLKADGVSVSYHPGGILRKQLLRHPWTLIWDIIRSTAYYVTMFRRYDVIYINTVVMLAALVAAAPYAFRRKLVLCHVREIPSRDVVWLFRLLLRFSGARLLFNSAATNAAFGLQGVVVHNGVPDPGCVCPSLDGRLVNILLLGRINAWKGQKFLLQTVAELPASVQEGLRFRIVGSAFDGYEFMETDLREFAKEQRIDHLVEFYEFEDSPAAHFSWATYVIVPSTLPEPFGRVAVEAFSYGRPVIGAAHGGLKEIVSSGCDGFLFEPGNHTALEEILCRLPIAGTSAYQELCVLARQAFVERFSLERYQARLRDALLNGTSDPI